MKTKTVPQPRVNAAKLPKQETSEISLTLKEPDVLRLVKYNGEGTEVKHEWLMSDGTRRSMTNPESIMYNFQMSRLRIRDELAQGVV